MSERTRTLERRLTGAIVVAVGLSLIAQSFVIYAAASERGRGRFDERLVEAGNAVARAVELREGRWTVDAEALADLDQSRGATVCQVWGPDGSVLARYPPDATPLDRPRDDTAPRFQDVALPGGASGRVFQAWLRPGSRTVERPAPNLVAVTLQRDTKDLEGRLARIRRNLALSALAIALLAGVVVSVLIRISLRGVGRISASIASMDVTSLGRRLEVGDLPGELRAPFVKINQLLSRMEAGLARERQFNADVSHELRTPLAGLRTVLEVSGSRERGASEYRAALGEALQIVGQIEAIVENLLALARLGAGQVGEEQRERVPVRELVQSCFAPLAETARCRGLTFENRIAGGVSVSTDGTKLRLVATNLLSNASQYTAEGGWIHVESAPHEGVILRVRDSGPSIPDDAIDKIFDPFFRLDDARAGNGEHLGIGLTLVRGLCDGLGYRVSVENEAGGVVSFTVAGPASSPPAERSAVRPSAVTG